MLHPFHQVQHLNTSIKKDHIQITTVNENAQLPCDRFTNEPSARDKIIQRKKPPKSINTCILLDLSGKGANKKHTNATLETRLSATLSHKRLPHLTIPTLGIDLYP